MGTSPRIAILVLAAVVVTGTAPAHAGVVETPQCRLDLARANTLIRDIRAREGSVKRGDTASLCALLKRNSADMSEAGRLMDRCLTGHERGENVGQIRDSLGDINRVLRERCK